MWSNTDNKANLSPASFRYAGNEAVAELGNIEWKLDAFINFWEDIKFWRLDIFQAYILDINLVLNYLVI